MTTTQNRTKINKKLLAYSTAASLALGTGVAQAAGVLIDVNPDEVLDGVFASPDTLDLDFDQDGNVEYQLVQGNPNNGAHAGEIQLRSNGGDSGLQFVGQSVGSYSYAKAMSLGDPINASTSGWMSAAGNNYLNYGTGGAPGANFVGAGSKYIGVRFQLDGQQYYYGWINIEIDATGDTVTVSRYYFNDTRDEGLFAGQSPTSINLQQISADATSSLPKGGIAFFTAVLAGLSGIGAWLRHRWQRQA